MQFVVLSRRRTESFPSDAFAQRLPSEIQRVRELYAEGFIRQIWQRVDLAGACLIIEAASEQEVTATLATLPLVAAEMLEIVSLAPLRPYPGFGAD